MTSSTVESASGRPPHAPTVVVAGSQVRPAEELFTALRKGSVLQKYGRRGTPKFHHFILSPDDKELQWKSSKNSVRSVNLLLVNQVLQGQRTPVFQRQLNPNVDHLSFSLLYNYKGSERSLDLVCKTSFEYETWYWGIQLVISCLRQGQPIIPPAKQIREGDHEGHEGYSLPQLPVTLERKREIGDCYIWGAPPKSYVEDAEEVTGWQTSNSPVLVHHTNALDIVKVACGPRHAVLITRGHEVYTWGVGSGGCLGHGNLQSQNYPSLAVHLLKKGSVSVCCGETMTAAVTKDGALYTWGTGMSGQLGHGNLSMYCTPTRVVALGDFKVVQVSCGPYHTCIVADNGMLFSWGDGLCGKLGHGNHDSVLVPKPVEALLDKRVVSVACGWWHTGAVAVPRKTDGPKAALQAAANAGSLYTWGGDFMWQEFETGKKGNRTTKRDNHKGSLGHGDLDGRLYPTPVTGQLDAAFVKQVVCGLNFTVVLTTDGRVFQMGSTSAVNAVEKKATWEGAKVPEPVDGSLQRLYAEEMACGMQHIAVVASIIDPQGTIPRESKRTKLLTWGRNHLGQLGLGTKLDHAAPQVVTSFGHRKILHVACGGNHTLAVCEHDPTDTLVAQAADLEGFQRIMAMAKKPPPSITIPVQSSHADSTGRGPATTTRAFIKKETTADTTTLTVSSSHSKSLTNQVRRRFKAGISSSVDATDPSRPRSMSLRLSTPASALPSPNQTSSHFSTPTSASSIPHSHSMAHHHHHHHRTPIPVVRSHSNLPTRAFKDGHLLNDDASSTTSSGLLTSQDSFQFPNAPPPQAITFSDPAEQAKWAALQERVKKLERQLQQRNTQVEQLRSAAVGGRRRKSSSNLLGLNGDDGASDSEVSTNPPPSPLSPSVMRSSGGGALSHLFRMGAAAAAAAASTPSAAAAAAQQQADAPSTTHVSTQESINIHEANSTATSQIGAAAADARRTTAESTTSVSEDTSRRNTMEPDLSLRLATAVPNSLGLPLASANSFAFAANAAPGSELEQLRLENAQLRKEVERLQVDVNKLQQQLQDKQEASVQEWPLLLHLRMQKAQQQAADRSQSMSRPSPRTQPVATVLRRSSTAVNPGATVPDLHPAGTSHPPNSSNHAPSTPSNHGTSNTTTTPAHAPAPAPAQPGERTTPAQLQPTEPMPFPPSSVLPSVLTPMVPTGSAAAAGRVADAAAPIEPQLHALQQPTPQTSPRQLLQVPHMASQPHMASTQQQTHMLPTQPAATNVLLPVAQPLDRPAQTDDSQEEASPLQPQVEGRAPQAPVASTASQPEPAPAPQPRSTSSSHVERVERLDRAERLTSREDGLAAQPAAAAAAAAASLADPRRQRPPVSGDERPERSTRPASSREDQPEQERERTHRERSHSREQPERERPDSQPNERDRERDKERERERDRERERLPSCAKEERSSSRSDNPSTNTPDRVPSHRLSLDERLLNPWDDIRVTSLSPSGDRRSHSKGAPPVPNPGTDSPQPLRPVVEPASLPPMQHHRRSRSADGFSRQPAVKSPRQSSQTGTPVAAGTIMEEVDPGVYLTLEPLGGGSFELRRIRFSKRHFTHVEAEAWWAHNKDRIKDQYNLVTPSHSQDASGKPVDANPRHQRSSSVQRALSLEGLQQRDKLNPVLPTQPSPEEWAITTTPAGNGNGGGNPTPRQPQVQ